MSNCPKCHQPIEQVGRGDGCLDPYCAMSDLQCVAERRIGSTCDAWLEQTWVRDGKTYLVALPPKHNAEDRNDVVFDYAAGRAMAERMSGAENEEGLSP